MNLQRVELKVEALSIGCSVTKGEESKPSCNSFTYFFLSKVSLQQVVGSGFISWLCYEQR